MTNNQARLLYPDYIIPYFSIKWTSKVDIARKNNRKEVRKLFSTVESYSWSRNIQYLAIMIDIFSLPSLCLSTSPLNYNHNQNIIVSQIQYNQKGK